MDDMDKRLTEIENDIKKINNKIDEIPRWDSIREMWTVKSAVYILILIVIAILINTIIFSKNSESFEAIFSNIILAILGYLFGYVPTKSNLDKVEEEKKFLKQVDAEKDGIITDYIEAVNKNKKVLDLLKAKIEEES